MSLTYATFRTFLLNNEPCLLPREVVQAWPICEQWRLQRPSTTVVGPTSESSSNSTSTPNYDYLGATFGHYPLSSVVDQGCLSAAEAPSTFGSLLDLWRNGDGRSLYLKDWHLPAIFAAQGTNSGDPNRSQSCGFYEVPCLWRDDWLNCYHLSNSNDDFRFVYAGGADTFTPLHRDVFNSFSISTNIIGTKRWYLFPPALTSALEPMLARARWDEGCVNVEEWGKQQKEDFASKGMMVFVQEEGETLFVPSGWHHHVTNLSHPTISLNHNWINAHNLPAAYWSLAREASLCAQSISDVKELLQHHNKVDWRPRWAECVSDLLSQSAGWNWSTFWAMILFALENCCQPHKKSSSHWPTVTSDLQPPVQYLIAQVQPLLADFMSRGHAEHLHLPGLPELLVCIGHQLECLGDHVRMS
ncbi:BQ2448_5712 [Microbotryum intermedium]|uniref:BQ2448_5712 protein n=1 Tax=Microbotryum intermedium TaxID=269621 RepID=A0A238F7J7_9BASI|nr:BQ2448_5712 [Microbotryum intermedium]